MDENVRRRPSRDEEMNSMSNIPNAHSHIGPDGKINLQLWKYFRITKASVMSFWIFVSKKDLR